MIIAKERSSLKLLLVVDDSASSMAAVGLLTQITWPPKASVHILTGVAGQLPETAPTEVRSAATEALELSRWRNWAIAKALLTPITHALHAHKLAVETEICEGQLPRVALTRSVDLSTHLIVIGATSFDKAEGSRLDPAIQKLVYEAHCSVLIVRSTIQVRPLSVILAVDDSAAAWQAVEFIRTLTLANWAKMTVTNVIEEEERLPAELGSLRYSRPVSQPPPVRDRISGQPETCATKVVRYLHDEGAQGWEMVRYGQPADEILDLAREREAVLIVIGAGSQTHPTSSPLGSVAKKVVQEALCSVLIVR
jgi:nucleotide-binding universal stress UspA family protein